MGRRGSAAADVLLRSCDMPHLELSGLTKRYGTLTSVDAIDLAVERGEFICLLGPSGCGKTTTLRMLAGFLSPDAGVKDAAAWIVAGDGTSKVSTVNTGTSLDFHA